MLLEENHSLDAKVFLYAFLPIKKISEVEHEYECGISPPKFSEVAAKSHSISKVRLLKYVRNWFFMNKVGLFERKLEPFLIR